MLPFGKGKNGDRRIKKVDSEYAQSRFLWCIQATSSHGYSNLRVQFHEVLANIEVIPTFIEEMKDKHFEDDSLSELTRKEISDEAQDVALQRVVCSLIREEFMFHKLMT